MFDPDDPRAPSGEGQERLQAIVEQALEMDPIPDAIARATLQELGVAFEELRVAEEELTAQAGQLAASAELIDVERGRYTDLFDFAPDAYVETDELGKILEANRSAEHLLDVPGRMLVGKLLVSFVDAQQRRRFRAFLGDAARVDRSREQRFTIVTRSGHRTPVGLATSSRPSTDGKARLRWLIRDITERVKLEGQVEELAEEIDLIRRIQEIQVLTTSVDPLERSLEELVDAAQDVDDDCDVGFTLARDAGRGRRLTSGPLATELDDLQHRAQTGPCIEALATGELRRGGVDRWPILGQATTGTVVEAVGIPLVAGGDVEGVLNVYARTNPVADRTFERVCLLASMASTGLRNVRLLTSSADLVNQLNAALQTRGVIERAKGLLMAQQRCTADAAFDLLRRASQRENVKLHDIAARIVQDAEHRVTPRSGP